MDDTSQRTWAPEQRGSECSQMPSPGCPGYAPEAKTIGISGTLPEAARSLTQSESSVFKLGSTVIEANYTQEANGHFTTTVSQAPDDFLADALIRTAVRPSRYDRNPPIATQLHHHLTTNTDRSFWYDQDFDSDRLNTKPSRKYLSSTGAFTFVLDSKDPTGWEVLTLPELNENMPLRAILENAVLGRIANTPNGREQFAALAKQAASQGLSDVAKIIAKLSDPNHSFYAASPIIEDPKTWLAKGLEAQYRYEMPIKNPTLIVNHAEYGFDADATAKAGIDALVATFKQTTGNSIIYLSSEHFNQKLYPEDREPTATVFSYGGEHNLRLLSPHITIVGGFFGNSEGAQGCLTMCLADTINRFFFYRNQEGLDVIPLNIKLPVDAMYYYTDNKEFGWNANRDWVRRHLIPRYPEFNFGDPEDWHSLPSPKEILKFLIKQGEDDALWRMLVLSEFYDSEPEEGSSPPIAEILAYNLLRPRDSNNIINRLEDLDNVQEWEISSEGAAAPIRTQDGYQINIKVGNRVVHQFASTKVTPDKVVNIILV